MENNPESNEEPNIFPKELQQYLPKINSLKDIGINKPLAKFGDSVTNLIYSIAKSAVIGKFDQLKVNRTILSMAFKEAGMKPYARVRSDAHDIADSAEAFIGYVYAANEWSIEKMAAILLIPLKDYNLHDYKMEREGATLAFTVLLEKIKEYLKQKLSL
ncbi:MAG: ribonuclease III family protein [Promethearchaeota archaeon]